MTDILREYHTSLTQSDLGASWEDELRLRKQLRADPAQVDGLVVETRAELDFIRRSLYFSPHRPVFWQCVYLNRDKPIVAEYLAQNPDLLNAEFFPYVAARIEAHPVPGRELLFLINLYREELHPAYSQLIGYLDKSQCSYIEAKTSNPGLRELLRQRLAQFAAESAPSTYSGPAPPALTERDRLAPYGSKLQVIFQATGAIRRAQEQFQDDPAGIDTLQAVLGGAEMLFAAGLITDCLTIVADLMQGSDAALYDNILDPDGVLHKSFHHLLRRAVPVYCLLAEPTNPHGRALQIYRGPFRGFRSEPGSLLYLDIISLAAASRHGSQQYSNWELAQKAAKLHTYRPNDHIASILRGWNQPGQDLDPPVLWQIITERMASLPHEAYAVMEMIRWGAKAGKLTLDRTVGNGLLHAYIRLFNWVPSSRFMNEALLRDLENRADEVTHRQAESILNHLAAGGLVCDTQRSPGSKRYWEVF